MSTNKIKISTSYLIPGAGKNITIEVPPFDNNIWIIQGADDDNSAAQNVDHIIPPGTPTYESPLQKITEGKETLTKNTRPHRKPSHGNVAPRVIPEASFSNAKTDIYSGNNELKEAIKIICNGIVRCREKKSIKETDPINPKEKKIYTGRGNKGINNQ